ncbi:thioredoxin fold domain-containing protein [Echinimonas agarilytica]|uniref:Thiol:disulfide interchange protein n=1 Tax=Echinimonas agarilytica TaxID=1215918 RepID=A0AA41W931_9GAMM|nr:thioredoxin fold domain-containing protein [Echinimonas agarilytica]MCM2681330.1 thioredoxin fold domain-containing protein [Echinimonas agarilytica]
MTKFLKVLSTILMTSFISIQTVAADDVDKRVSAKIFATFGEMPAMVTEAPIPGYRMAVTSQGNFFVSNDAKYMMYGRLFDITDGLKEITDSGLNDYRAEKLKTIKDDVITYPAIGEEKYNVYVFTDITCGYCRKLHRQMEEYQKAGITINYLAFPRSPQAAESMQKIWCADDPVDAMNKAKIDDIVAGKQCDSSDQRVTMQHDVGVKFGVRGTPAMVLEDGTMMPGYREPSELVETLQRAMN